MKTAIRYKNITLFNEMAKEEVLPGTHFVNISFDGWYAETMSKGDVVEMAKEAGLIQGNIDCAPPNSFIEECKENNIDHSWYVWYYPKSGQSKVFGKPLDLFPILKSLIKLAIEKGQEYQKVDGRWQKVGSK